MPKEFVKKYIDLIALHKMNSFHWHLTDDQGWRIEIKKYPRLTDVGAWRDRTIVGRQVRDTANAPFDNKRHGGFYTQDDIREIVAYARDRFVSVVPEIEMPGHSQAAGRGLSDAREFRRHHQAVDDVGRHQLHPQSFGYDHRVHAGRLTEVMALFPGQIHSHRRRRGSKESMEGQPARAGANEDARHRDGERTAELVHDEDG
jgi:hexosaminidase